MMKINRNNENNYPGVAGTWILIKQKGILMPLVFIQGPPAPLGTELLELPTCAPFVFWAHRGPVPGLPYRSCGGKTQFWQSEDEHKRQVQLQTYHNSMKPPTNSLILLPSACECRGHWAPEAGNRHLCKEPGHLSGKYTSWCWALRVTGYEVNLLQRIHLGWAFWGHPQVP